MSENKDNSVKDLKIGDIIIFLCDEWRDGQKSDFDGNILSVSETGVDVVYLSGYRSRNDFIPFDDIVAKVDKSMPEIKLNRANYRGRFIEYSNCVDIAQEIL